MKIYFVSFFLILFAGLPFIQAQDRPLYVTADNGLIIRDQPDRKGNRIGKLEYGTRIRVIENTGKKLELVDDGETISGEWLKIRKPGVIAIGESEFGYVFDGYLTQKRLGKRLTLIYPNFTIKIDNLDTWDGKGQSRMVGRNYVLVEAGLGSFPSKSFIKIIQTKYKKVEVFQQQESSITINDEGPHCDLVNWKHYYSDWKPLVATVPNAEFATNEYSSEDWNRFVKVDGDELKEAVRTHCGERYYNLIKDQENLENGGGYASISQVFFKIVLTDQQGNQSEKIIAVTIPMGC